MMAEEHAGGGGGETAEQHQGAARSCFYTTYQVKYDLVVHALLSFPALCILSTHPTLSSPHQTHTPPYRICGAGC